MLTGSVPFQSNSKQELRRQILHDDPQPARQINNNIPEALERACSRAMAKRISHRFTTAADFSSQLHSILAGTTNVAGSPNPEPVAVADDAAHESRSRSESVAPPAAGRRHVTVLHVTTSLRGINDELDPEDQMEAMGVLQTECQTHIDQFGGSCLPSGSHELTVCFGYPLSYEDAPRRAVHTAMAIQQSVRQLADDLAKRLNVNVQVWTSVHSGIVLTGGAAAQPPVGETLTLVTKIDRDTQPGEVIVSEQTRRLIQHFFQCDLLDVTCHLPGAEALPLYRVDHSLAEHQDQSEFAGIEDTPLVGRDQEVNMLLDRWDLVGEGYGQLVALIGDAGLGKSRLVQVLKQHVQNTSESPDPPIIEWSCSAYHGDSAFHPAKDALAKVLKFDRDLDNQEKVQRLRDHLQDLGLPLAGTMPLFCDLLSLPHDPEFPPPAISSAKQKESTLQSLHQWLEALARQRPLLFIVEDLHWIDPSTLDFLAGIANEPIREPFLCLLTFRPEFTTPWTSSAHQTQIALNRLTRKQIDQIVESKITRGTVPQGLIDRIADRTDGVPLFVEEYAKMLAEAAATMDDTVDQIPDSTLGSQSGGIPIPTTLQGLLMARLDRIGGDPRVVRLAATIGRQFSFELLSAAAADIPAEALATELEKLVESQLLFRRGATPDCTYQFKHALIQDAAYDSMLRSQRRETHQQIANALEKKLPDIIAERPEVLAHHRSEAGQHLAAVPLWAAAGSMATERGEFIEAVNHLQRGLQNLAAVPECKERDRLEYQINVPLGIATLSVRGYAAPELGQIYERRMQLCQDLNDSMGQLHADWAMASWRIVRDEVEICLGIGQRMMKMAGEMKDDGALMEALFIRAISQFYHGEFRASLESCQRGWEFFQPQRTLFHTSRTGQHAGVAHLAYMALNHWYLGQPASALARMEQALELATSLDHPFSVAFALHHFGWLNAAMRRGEEAVSCGDRQIKVAQDQAFFFWETTGMLFRAGGLIWRDRHQEAKENLLPGLARYDATGAKLAFPQYSSFLALACLELGELDQAGEAINQGFAAMKESAECFHEPELWRMRGQLAAARGDRIQAISLVRKAIEVARRQGSLTWELTALVDLAGWTDQQSETDPVLSQLEAALQRFEPCEIEIPIINQAKEILN